MRTVALRFVFLLPNGLIKIIAQLQGKINLQKVNYYICCPFAQIYPEIRSSLLRGKLQVK